jgi:hypothetical protein
VSNIVEILIEQILGEAAAKKEVEVIRRKTPEARQATLPYHAYQILAQSVSFNTYVIRTPGWTDSKLTSINRLPLLIDPLKDFLETTQTLTEVKKITEVLRYVAMGLSSNPSVGPREVLIYVHSLVDKYLVPLPKVNWPRHCRLWASA